MDGGFKEGNTNEIHLPEDDPKVFNIILHVLYHDELARLLRPISGDGCDAYLLFNLLLDVYIAADKYCFEQLQNRVVTFFAEMCKTTIFRATLISRLTKAGLVDSRLRALLLQNKAYELAWEGYAACCDYDKTLADVFQGGGVDSVHILEASLVLAQADGEDPALIENYCDLYHVHHSTKKCKTATR